MKITYVSGSPRKKSNTDELLRLMQHETGGELLKLSDYTIEPCRSCWACRELKRCVIEDDMSEVLAPKLLASDAIVIGCPVYFNNVPSHTKALMDRTWALRGQLRNRVGGAIVVGRRYGGESAITALNAFFLKHEMIPANRGVYGLALEAGEVSADREAIEATKRLAQRIRELGDLLAI